MITSVYNSKGVTATAEPGCLRIHLPRLTSSHDCSGAMDALQEIYDQTPQTVDWVVDVSALEVLPVVILAILVAFQEKFQCRGHRILLAGVDPDWFQHSFMKEIVRRFLILSDPPLSRQAKIAKI